MASTRAAHGSVHPVPSQGARGLQHPAAVFSMALALLALYGWTFTIHPHRLAPRLDPAYYSWRIETLISEKPSTLLHITGPFGTFAGGYRIASTLLGGYLRRVAGVSLLKTTVVLIVAQWTVIALLLGGFAYRQRRDPLIFYVVAAASGSLLLTFPFVGYADNTLCLLFLAAAIWFIPEADNWRARLGAGLFLVVCGFTHPTTLAIFCIALVVMAGLRMLVARLHPKAILQREGPVLATAGIALVVMYLSWKIGIWGVSQSLSEAAKPPPRTTAVFLSKTLLWAKTMYPLWNGPLLAIGLVGTISTLRRTKARDDLSRVSLGWLVPVLGIFGFVLGLAYPYYRFLNSTLAWVLLVGVGAYLSMRFCIDTARRGGAARLALLGVLAVALAIASNFLLKVTDTQWNDPHGGWLSVTKQRDLDAVRAALSRSDSAGRPVVFVVDLASRYAEEVYGFAKNSGNLSRYGLPAGDLDKGYLYLGSLTNFLSHQATRADDPTYERLSRGYLADALAGIRVSGKRPIIVVAKDFNSSGANARFFHGAQSRPSSQSAEIWLVKRGRVITPQGTVLAPRPASAPAWHLVRVVVGMMLLLLPGLIGARRLIFHPSLAEMLGMVPALSMALLALAGIVILAVVRAPFSTAISWASLALSTVFALLLPRARRAS